MTNPNNQLPLSYGFGELGQAQKDAAALKTSTLSTNARKSLKIGADGLFDRVGLFAGALIDAAVDDAHDRKASRVSVLDALTARATGSPRPSLGSLRAEVGNDPYTSDADLEWQIANVDGPAWGAEAKGAFRRLVKSPRSIGNLGVSAALSVVGVVGTKAMGLLNEIDAATRFNQVGHNVSSPPVTYSQPSSDREFGSLQSQVDAQAIDQSSSGL